MADVKITDLVPQETIDKIKELNAEMQNVLATYTNVAKELAKGIQMKVDGIDDIAKMEELLAKKSKEAAELTEQLNRIMAERQQVIGQTTPVIAKNLMEVERLNKAHREEYTDGAKVQEILDKHNTKYKDQVRELQRLESALEKNKAAQAANKKALKDGLIDVDAYNEKQVKLIASHRALTQEKRNLTLVMSAEEKAMLAVDTSYDQMSQQLALLKKAYRQLSAEDLKSDMGKEMELAIQNLSQHLNELDADMGEFHRNVGNYAIAGQNGVVSTESLTAAMQQQAITTKDLVDQNKILTEAKGMLDTSDANYAATVEAINEKLAENKRRLTDVSDIMDVQATSVAEAEAQNQRLTEALKNVDLSSDEAKETMDALNAKIAENDKIIKDNSASQATLKKDLKELVLEIATLSLEYSNLSEEEQKSADGQALKSHIDDLIEKAGALKDAISDTNAAISNAASDTRTFDQVSEGLQVAIDGFGLATGAAEMLGISEGELAEIQTKLQAAIAASNAVQSIQNSLQAQSALMQGVNLVQTRLRTVAENLHTAAQGKGVIATTALTAAQWAFNAAANANPIGLVVVAITACIAAVWGLVKAFQAFFGPSEQALENYKQQKVALEELCDANDQLIERMKARGATEAELLNQSLQNKEAERNAANALFEQAKELYDEDEDEYKEALEAKKKADEDFEASKEDSLNYLLGVIHEAEEEEKKQRLGTYEYKRQLIQAELEQQKAIAATLLAQEKITRQVYENLCASLDKAAQLKIDKVNNDEKEAETKKVGGGRSRSTGGGSSRSANNNASDDLKKQVQAGEDALLKIIEDSLERQRAAENLSYQRKLKELKDALKKTKDTQVKLRTAINNQIEGLEAEHARKLNEIYYSQVERYQKAESDFISSHLEIVQEGSQEELDWKLKQLQNQRDQELTALWKAEEEKTLTIEQATEMRANLILKYQKLEEEAEAEHAQKVVDIIEDRYAKEQTQRDTNLILATTQLKQQYAEELRLAGNNEDKREEAKMRHDARMLQLQNSYAQETLRNTIDMLEKMLEAEDLNADARLEIEQRLARAKAELEEKMVDQTVDTLEKTGNKFQQWLDKNKKYIDAFGQMASDIFNGLNDLMQTLYDNQISKIEEQQEFNEEAGEAEQERITELVEKKVITEEEGEARKRAAEAATAKKNEELEKKKQQLKIKQAKWDKANSIAQAVISTGVAIVNALQQQPPWLGIAMAAVVGAMGAVQIATIAAQPIPAYAKGTDYHKGGPAIVGDGGRSELVIFNDKAWLTPDTPTLIDLPQGASVIPDPLGIKELVSVPRVESIPEKQIIVNSYDDRNFRRDVSELAYLIRQNTKQQREIAYRQEYELFKAAKGL